MAFSWFAVDNSVTDHPKVMRLSAWLNEPLALAYVVRLWAWAQKYAPEGLVEAEIAPQLERAIGWTGDAGALIEALCKVGLLDRMAAGFSVHDWDEHQGALVEKSKRDAELKRKRRRQNGAKTARAGRTNGASTAPAQDTTGQDKTGDEKTEKLAGKKPPADPRLAPLTGRLVAVYGQERGAAYKHGGPKDTLALKALLPVATDDEIVAKWRLGLRASGWASCSTFAQLGSKWNDLGAPTPTRQGGLTLPVVPSEQGHTTRDLTETF